MFSNFNIDDVLNNDYLAIDRSIHKVHVYDMKAYKTLTNLHYTIPVSSRAKESFVADVLSKPPIISLGKYKSPPTELLSEYVKRNMNPLVGALFDVEMPTAVAGFKMVEDEKEPFPVCRAIDMTEGIMFSVTDKKTQKTTLYWQWFNPQVISQTQATKKMKNGPRKITKKSAENAFRGFDMDSIPYDNEVFFYGADSLRPIKDQTIRFINNTQHHIDYGGPLDSRLNEMTFQSSFTSPIITIFKEYNNFYRSSENGLRVYEKNMNPTLYVENEIGNNMDAIMTMYNPQKTQRQKMFEEERRRLFSKKSSTIIPNEMTNIMPSSSMASLFEYSKDIRQKKQGSAPYTEATTEVIGGTNNKDPKTAFVNANMDSWGIFNEPKTSGGRKVVVGGPTHRFKWAPQVTTTQDYDQRYQRFMNILHENYTLPTSSVHKNKNAKMSIDETERTLGSKRIKAIATKIAAFFKVVLEKIMGRQKTYVIEERKKYNKNKGSSFDDSDFYSGYMYVNVEFVINTDVPVGDLKDLFQLGELPQDVKAKIVYEIEERLGYYGKNYDNLTDKEGEYYETVPLETVEMESQPKNPIKNSIQTQQPKGKNKK